jgi:hypothetical protein
MESLLSKAGFLYFETDKCDEFILAGVASIG